MQARAAAPGRAASGSPPTAWQASPGSSHSLPGLAAVRSKTAAISGQALTWGRAKIIAWIWSVFIDLSQKALAAPFGTARATGNYNCSNRSPGCKAEARDYHHPQAREVLMASSTLAGLAMVLSCPNALISGVD